MIGVVVSALVSCTEVDAGLGVLDLPPVGSVEPGLLTDGSPVFVVHDLDGTVSVLQAESTHNPEEPVAWCPSSRTIDGLLFGSRWDTHGRYVAGPAPRDLASYQIRLDGERIVVLAHIESAPRSPTSDGFAGPNCESTGDYRTHPHFESESQLPVGSWSKLGDGLWSG